MVTSLACTFYTPGLVRRQQHWQALWGGPPGPRPTPSSACRNRRTISQPAREAGQGCHRKVEMSPLTRNPPEQGPPFPHLRIAFASRTGAVKAAFWAPEGSLDGWPRCKIISHEGMAGSSWFLQGTLLLCSTGTFLLCGDIIAGLGLRVAAAFHAGLLSKISTPNTRCQRPHRASPRDALKLFFLFLAGHEHKPVAGLTLDDVRATNVLAFADRGTGAAGRHRV